MKNEFKVTEPDSLVIRLQNSGKEFFYKKHTNTVYVLSNDTLFTFSKSKEFNKGLYLFGLVKKDFDNYLMENPNPIKEDFYAPIRVKKEIYTGCEFHYDINHAYWRIAYINGYISENTYNHGLNLKNSNEELKKLYCMALSVQGQSKTLDGYVNNKITGNTYTINKNPLHKLIYQNIRNKTHKIVSDISDKIWEDFIEYRVDGIFFNGKNNCEIVENHLIKENLTFKKYNYDKNS